MEYGFGCCVDVVDGVIWDAGFVCSDLEVLVESGSDRGLSVAEFVGCEIWSGFAGISV